MSKQQAQQTTDSLMSKLFRWKTTVEINGVLFYVRVVGDSVIEDARKHGLLASRKLRIALRDKDSDEYLIHLAEIDDLTKDELSGFIQIAASREVIRDYMANNPKPQLSELPMNPSQEEQEEYEAAKEQRDADYVQEMQEHVENWRKNFEEELNKRSEADLRVIAKKYRTDEVCEALFISKFEDYVVANSIYTDANFKNRAFTVEEYVDLPSDVKRTFYNAYNAMNISADDLKN